MAYAVSLPVSSHASRTIIARAGILSPFAERPVKGRGGFSLVELLTTLTIVSVLVSLVSLSFQSILGTEFDAEVSNVTSMLVEAKVYAMANNTYAFVGISETDDSVPSTTTPQTAGNGRVTVVVVASNDGTRGYPSTAPTSLSASGLTIVMPPRHFENVHLLASSGISSLPNASTGNTYNIQNTNSLTTFQWPLTGKAQYSFGATPGTVVQFNPQGEAQIMPTGTSNDNILQWIEIDLVQTHGKYVSASNPNTAAILIAGPSGAATFYRK